MSDAPTPRTMPSPADEQAEVMKFYDITSFTWSGLTDRARNALTAQFYHGPLAMDYVWRTYE